MEGDAPRQFSRISQVRALSVAAGAALVVLGVLTLDIRRAGCPHDHGGPQSTCLDLSAYSPYVVRAWLLVAAGFLLPVLTLAVTAVARRLMRPRSDGS